MRIIAGLQPKPCLVYERDGMNTVPLTSDSVSIGRLAEQDIVLHDNFVSRRHARISRLEDGFELEDLHSSHGTWLNGKRVERAILRDGDVLQFGSPNAACMRFQFGDIGPEKTEPERVAELLSKMASWSDPATAQRPVAREMEQLNFLLSAARKLNAGGAKLDILQALVQLSIQLILREGRIRLTL